MRTDQSTIVFIGLCMGLAVLLFGWLWVVRRRARAPFNLQPVTGDDGDDDLHGIDLVQWLVLVYTLVYIRRVYFRKDNVFPEIQNNFFSQHLKPRKSNSTARKSVFESMEGVKLRKLFRI